MEEERRKGEHGKRVVQSEFGIDAFLKIVHSHLELIFFEMKIAQEEKYFQLQILPA